MKGADHAIEEFTLFGKYKVISTLGAGNFGTVYLAEHLKLKVLRAVKCIPKELAQESSLSLEEGFLSEAYLLKNLNHPGIPLIYDIDEDNEFIYMIEEFIQGESLDTFVLHQKNISQELIFQIGIQLCDILDYLHHLSPYPILYQDLKPEHIILCGNQVKLIDFGIASLFTGSGKNLQIYGTEGFAAPEALYQLPVTQASDLYSLGKVLEYLTTYVSPKCSSPLLHIIKQATAEAPSQRYPSAQGLKSALQDAASNVCRNSSHLIQNIAVIGSRPGAGATHFSISLVSAANKLGFPCMYLPANPANTLPAMAESNFRIKEKKGVYTYEFFQGTLSYGNGIEHDTHPDCCLVTDYDTCPKTLTALEHSDYIFCILSGSDWDMPTAISFAKRFDLLSQTIFICNFHQKKAARKLARALGKKVYCFPFDENPYHVTLEKERLFSTILPMKGGKHNFLF